MNQDKQIIEAQKDAEYLERIQERFEERQNEARQRRRRQYALEWVSYFFNAVSIVTASYFVVSLTSNYAGYYRIAFAAALIGVLVLVEVGKRYFTTEIGEGAPVWAFPLVVFVCASFYASYQGGERFTVETAEAPPVERNAAIDSLSVRIAEIDAGIATWRRQTWRGKIVTDARRGIAALEKTKIGLIQQRAALESRDLSRNDNTQAAHSAEMRQYGNVFGAVAGCADLLLIACLLIAKADEHAVRRLMRLNANKGERERSRERERTFEREQKDERTAPHTTAEIPVPVPVSAPAQTPADVAQMRYAQLIGRQFHELDGKVAALAEQVEKFVRAQEGERERANERKDEREREQKPEQTPNTGNAPKWVAQAKRMRASGKSYDEIAAHLKKAKSTVHKWVNS